MLTDEEREVFEEGVRAIGQRLVFICSWLPPEWSAASSLMVVRLKESSAAKFGLVSIALGLSLLARRSLMPQPKIGKNGELVNAVAYLDGEESQKLAVESVQRGEEAMPLYDSLGNYGHYLRALSQVSELFCRAVRAGEITTRSMPSRVPRAPAEPLRLAFQRHRTRAFVWRGLSLDLARTLSKLDMASDDWPDMGLLLSGYVDRLELESWAERNGLHGQAQDTKSSPVAAPAKEKAWSGEELCQLEVELKAAGHHRDHNKRTQTITGLGERKIRALKAEHRASLRPSSNGVDQAAKFLQGGAQTGKSPGKAR